MNGTVTTRVDAESVAEQVCAGLTQLLDAEFWKFPGDELLDTARTVEKLARLTYAVQVAVAGEIDLARLAQTHGQPSTATLLREVLSIGPADARGRVRAAAQIMPQDAISGGEIPPQLPELGHALTDGDLGVEQTSIVVKTMARIPTDIPADIREHAEHTLVGHARQMDPKHLARVAQKLLDTLDPDGHFEPNDPADRAELALGSRDARTGLTPIRGRLDDQTVAAFIAATDPHAKPRPETDGIKDQRSAATRLAQALTAVLDAYLALGDGPTQGGERPHIAMTIDFDAIKGRLGSATLTGAGTPVPAAVARRLLCDCDVIPAVLGSNGEPLDIGGHPHLAHRNPPGRDPAGRRMRLPRLRPTRPVGRPASPHWADGGPTSLANAAVLCGPHHTLIHAGDWQIRMATDGHPEVIPPTWIDPRQRPRRNMLHRRL